MRHKVEAFSNCPPRLYDGRVITSSLLTELYSLREYDWKFVEAMMKVDPERRPTARQLLRHPWLEPLLPSYHPKRLYSRARLALLRGLVSTMKGLSFVLDRVLGEHGAGTECDEERKS